MKTAFVHSLPISTDAEHQTKPLLGEAEFVEGVLRVLYVHGSDQSSPRGTPRKKKPKGGEDAETAHMRELERKIHGTMPQVAGQLIALLDEDRYEA